MLRKKSKQGGQKHLFYMTKNEDVGIVMAEKNQKQELVDTVLGNILT